MDWLPTTNQLLEHKKSIPECFWIDYIIYQDRNSLEMTHIMCQLTPHILSKRTQAIRKWIK